MFQIDPPEVFPVLRRNEFVEDSSDNAALTFSKKNNNNNRKVVVVSVFGTSSSLTPTYSGFKRAFKLAIDAFGNAKIFSEHRRKKVDGADKANEDVNVDGSVDAEVEAQVEEIAQLLENVDVGREEEIISTTTSTTIGDDGEFIEGSLKKEGGNMEHPPNGNVPKLDTCYIDAFYCKTESIVFLHLSGPDDPVELLMAADELHQSIQQSGFLPVWSSLKSVYCRYLLLIFSLSHVVMFSERSSSFNTNYLHLFRVLDAVRLIVKPALSRGLEKVGVLGKDWCNHARICSPRLLFLFEVKSGSPTRRRTAKTFHYRELDKKQTDLENEIYHIFRKCRVITNISANSLFAIPSEDEYVFLFDKSAQNVTYLEMAPQDLYTGMIKLACSVAKGYDMKPKKSAPPSYRSTSGTSIKQAFRAEPLSVTYCDILEDFKEFILHHARLALNKGFDDDSRRVADYKHFFVVPTLGEWKIGFRVLHDIILNPDVQCRTVTEGFDKLMRYINVDSEYLHNQCSNVFPKIYAVYQRGLPEYYSEHKHRLGLTHAMNAYLTISRGPGVVPWLNKLAEKCDQYWRRGRQQCEILSLFKHPCVNPLHRVPVEDSLEIYPVPALDSNLPEMKHNAGARIISHCNCGRKQGYRDEPFTIREANYGFYRRMGKECCDRLESIDFPVFIPTAIAEVSLEDMLEILKSKSEMEPSNTVDTACVEKQSYASQMMEIDLRQDVNNELGDEGDGDEDGSGASQSQDGNEISDETQNDIVKFSDSTNSKEEAVPSCNSDKSMSEYLPGMIHSKSPLGLLPKFSSWALVRLGTSSLYNHSSGISPRGGFLSGTNYLLPWDVIVKAEAGVSKPVPRIIRGRRPSSRPKPIPNEFNVKIFFGLEYECHRGHRFMANDAEKVVNFSAGNAGLRESACKVAESDMPLYFKCPCKESRDGRIMIAQLMRVHVVTPKAPVHCMLFPRVQPASSHCPTFIPGLSDPVKLIPSSYWVLRLPYCYVGDHQIYGPPMDTNESHARLLKELFSVKSMTPAETKIWEKENL